MKIMSYQLTVFVLAALLYSVAQGQQVSLGSCIQYSAGVCIKCDRQTHLYQNICYTNILGCIKYSTGNICQQCDSTSFVLVGSTCTLRSGLTLTQQLIQKLYLYGGQGMANPGDKYGQSNFVLSSYDAVKNFSSFLALNTFIIRGQYGHYISRMSMPIYSVSYYTKDTTYSYKILYHGSGGGLFLCIADVPVNLKVELRSLTPISASNIIDLCIDYQTNGTCVRCGSNYHLQNKRCYPNLGGCVKYRQNICIQCLDYYMLIENRCVSDCLSVSDARSILYYENNRRNSTLQQYYGVQLSRFYGVTITKRVTTVITTTTTYTTNIGSIGTSSSSSSAIDTTSKTSSSSANSNTNTNFNTNFNSNNNVNNNNINTRSGGNQNSVSGGGSSSVINFGSNNSSTVINSGLTLNNNSIFDNTNQNAGIVLINGNNSMSSSASGSGAGSAGSTVIISKTTTTTTTTTSGSSPILGDIINSLKISTLPSIETTGTNVINTPNNNTSSSFSSSSSSSSSSQNGGSINIGGISIINTDTIDNSIDPNCAVFNPDKSCSKCSTYFYKNKQNKCEQVSPFCQTYSQENGQCLTCFPGFLLSNGQCKV